MPYSASTLGIPSTCLDADMTQISVFHIAACVAAISLGASGALAGSKPASPTAIVPPPPPVWPPVADVDRVTPPQAQAAQALLSVITNNPPPTMTAAFKARTLEVLKGLLGRPDLHAPLGLTPSQIRTLIDLVQAIPVTPA